MTRPITIGPTAMRLLNDLRKAGASAIETYWHDGSDRGIRKSTCQITVWWSRDVADRCEGNGKTSLAALRDVIRVAKERGNMK